MNYINYQNGSVEIKGLSKKAERKLAKWYIEQFNSQPDTITNQAINQSKNFLGALLYQLGYCDFDTVEVEETSLSGEDCLLSFKGIDSYNTPFLAVFNLKKLPWSEYGQANFHYITGGSLEPNQLSFYVGFKKSKNVFKKDVYTPYYDRIFDFNMYLKLVDMYKHECYGIELITKENVLEKKVDPILDTYKKASLQVNNHFNKVINTNKEKIEKLKELLLPKYNVLSLVIAEITLENGGKNFMILEKDGVTDYPGIISVSPLVYYLTDEENEKVFQNNGLISDIELKNILVRIKNDKARTLKKGV